MAKSPPSKLFKLKQWLTLPEAAKHLSGICGEEVTESDVLRLALDRLLTLSVNLVNHAYAKPKKVVYFDEEERRKLIEEGYYKIEFFYTEILSSLNNKNLVTSYIDEGKYITSAEDNVVIIDGIWDLPMIGGEIIYVENKYHELTGGPLLGLCNLDGTFVSKSDGILWQLQGTFGSDEEDCFGYRENWQTQLNKIRRLSLKDANNPRKEKLLNLRKEKAKKQREIYEDWIKTRRFFPSGGLPEDSVLVVRTEALREFEERISEDENPQQTNLSQTEHNNLLKQIGGLALVLAEKNNRYKKGNTPSASAIAESVLEILESLPDANRYGLGKSSIRASISTGLKLMSK